MNPSEMWDRYVGKNASWEEISSQPASLLAQQIAELQEEWGIEDDPVIAAEAIIGYASEQLARSSAAVVLGSARSQRKAAASRANGRRGGRPRKSVA